MSENTLKPPFTPWSIVGVSMNDGSISFGPKDARFIIGYVTNACSFGDFVSAAMKGRRDFGAPDTAVTQMEIADFLVRSCNAHDDLVAALDEAINYVAAHAALTKSDDAAAFLDKCTAALARASGHEAEAA